MKKEPNYLTTSQYCCTAIIGVILLVGIVFGFPLLVDVVGGEIMNLIIIVIIVGCVVTLAYFRIDLALRGLFN